MCSKRRTIPLRRPCDALSARWAPSRAPLTLPQQCGGAARRALSCALARAGRARRGRRAESSQMPCIEAAQQRQGPRWCREVPRGRLPPPIDSTVAPLPASSRQNPTARASAGARDGAGRRFRRQCAQNGGLYRYGAKRRAETRNGHFITRRVCMPPSRGEAQLLSSRSGLNHLRA